MKPSSAKSGPIPLWQQQSRQWASVRPPLRPSSEDLLLAQDAVDQQSQNDAGPMSAVLLGVTPEFLKLRWPHDARFLAVDLSDPMIRGVWAEHSQSLKNHWAVRGDWLNLPVATASIDLAIGDGCVAFFAPAQQSQLARSIQRNLKPQGHWLIRVFTRPQRTESPEQVWENLLAQQIGNFHIFKFRLLAALADAQGAVAIARAWDAVHQWISSLDALADRLGWPREEVQTLNAYRGQKTQYWFPTLDQFRGATHPYLEEIYCRHPHYEMGDRCPTLLFKPRPLPAF